MADSSGGREVTIPLLWLHRVTTALPEGGGSVEKPTRIAPAPPQRSREFAHLPLAGLRQYRKALAQEESRVSYWRRILQARLDMVRASNGWNANIDHLRPVLAETRLGTSRKALIDIVPIQDIPPLPNLEEL